MAAMRLLSTAALVALFDAAAAETLAWGLVADDACVASPSSSCAVGLLQHATASAESRLQRQRLHRSATDAVPASMKACMRGRGGSFAVQETAVPKVSTGEVLVKVQGSSVNPLDWKLPMPGPAGLDFSGTVVEVGEGCGVQVGDEVWGDASGGAWAEYLAVDCNLVGIRPSKASAAEAGAMPHAALTAQQALATAHAPWSNSPTVLVLGGAGGVGHFAIQMAKAYGAGTVVTTCSSSHFEFVKSLGADETIDYHTAKWWETLPKDSVDVIVDTVGEQGTSDHANVVLRQGGRFLTLSSSAMGAEPPKPQTTRQFMRMSDKSTRYLDSLKALVDAGKLTVHIDQTFTLDEAPKAVATSQEGHNVGKVAISIS